MSNHFTNGHMTEKRQCIEKEREVNKINKNTIYFCSKQCEGKGKKIKEVKDRWVKKENIKGGRKNKKVKKKKQNS